MRIARSVTPLALLSLGASLLAAQAGSPAGPVPPERLAARRAALAERMRTGIAVLRSARERSIEGDYPQDSDYREDNDFFYLTGLEAPNAWLVVVAQGTAPDRIILYLPARDSIAERWTGAKLGPGPEASKLTGIDDIRPADRAESEIRSLIFAPQSPARAGALYIKRRQQEAESSFFRDLVFTPAASDPITVNDLAYQTAALRMIKDADELARLRKAIEITVEAQREAWRMAKPGVWEYELEAIIEYTFRRRGAERLGCPSIIGSGPNTTSLHYDKGRRQAQAGELVIADICAEFGYYTSDLTRTFPVSGRFSERQRALYNLVLATQQAAIDSVRPGITVGRLNQIARKYMRDHSGTLCGALNCDQYFVHGLSHWLGMDVHDVGDYTTPLAPGMVLTIEPGIYLREEKIGIRIEDDVLVTTRGAELLSASLPRKAEGIEAAMARTGRSSSDTLGMAPRTSQSGSPPQLAPGEGGPRTRRSTLHRSASSEEYQQAH